MYKRKKEKNSCPLQTQALLPWYTTVFSNHVVCYLGIQFYDLCVHFVTRVLLFTCIDCLLSSFV